MSARVITPPTMDLNRDIGSQNMPDAATGQPSVVALPEAGEGGAAGLPESAGVPISTHHLIPSPAVSPNNSMMGPTTELVLSTHMHIRSVSRCLFGSPDPTSRAFAQERVREIRQNDKTKYNFDFDAEVPLDGRFKWEAVRVAPPTTTSSNTGSGGYAPKAYALSRLPFLSGTMVDRGMISPPPRTINNNLPPARQLYFQPDIPEREPLLIARPAVSPSSTYTTTASRPVASVIKSTVTSLNQSSSSERVPPVDPSKFLPSPEASSCSSEDFVNDVDMELEDVEDEEVATSVESSSTEDDLKQVLHDHHQSAQTTSSPSSSPSAGNVARVIQHNTGSGYSSRQCSISSTSSTSSSSRRTKSVSSSSSSPSASPSSPTSSQPPITRFMPQRKRPASTSTTKAASESAPESSAASTEIKRAAL